MSRPRAVAPVVAILGWGAAAALKDNGVLLRHAGLIGESRPRRRLPSAGHRSLVVRADGSCALERFSPGTAARRLFGAVGGNTSGKAGTGQRG